MDAVHAACQDAEVQRWIPLPVPYLRQHAESWVADAPEQWAREDELRFVVVDPADGSLVGAQGLHARDATMREIGFWTAPHARGRGLTTAAARAACRWGFELLGLRRVQWTAALGNWPSRRVAERLGFVVEGTLRRGLLQRGERLDAWVGGLLPEDLRRAREDGAQGTDAAATAGPRRPVSSPAAPGTRVPRRRADPRGPAGRARPVDDETHGHGGAGMVEASNRGRTSHWIAVAVILSGVLVGGVGLTLGPAWPVVAIGAVLAAGGGIFGIATGILTDVE